MTVVSADPCRSIAKLVCADPSHVWGRSRPGQLVMTVTAASRLKSKEHWEELEIRHRSTFDRSASLLRKAVTYWPARKFRWLVSIRVRDLAAMWEAVLIGISWKCGALRVQRLRVQQVCCSKLPTDGDDGGALCASACVWAFLLEAWCFCVPREQASQVKLKCD